MRIPRELPLLKTSMSSPTRTRHGPHPRAAGDETRKIPVPNPLIIVAKLVNGCYGDVNKANRGDGVSDGSERDLARSMIRLYGRDAESVAMGHAETHADMGDQIKSDKWQRIAEAIADLRVHKSATGG